MILSVPKSDSFAFDTLKAIWRQLPALPAVRYAGTMQLVGNRLHFVRGSKRIGIHLPLTMGYAKRLGSDRTRGATEYFCGRRFYRYLGAALAPCLNKLSAHHVDGEVLIADKDSTGLAEVTT
jgi:hypothetical protein